MADSITGLHNLTIGDGPGTMTVFRATSKTVAHWVEFWRDEAKDGRFGALTIEESGSFDHSKAATTHNAAGSGPFRVQTWRSAGGVKSSVVHRVGTLDAAANLLIRNLEDRDYDGSSRMTKASVTLEPAEVSVMPKKETVETFIDTPIYFRFEKEPDVASHVTGDVLLVSRAILTLADVFGDWTHIEEVVPSYVEAAAWRLVDGF